MRIYREEEEQNCSFLLEAADSYSNFWGTQRRGGWLDPKAASLDIVEKRKISCSCQGIKPQFLGHPPYSLDFMPAELHFSHNVGICTMSVVLNLFSYKGLI
jgi:hypothetical protein